MKKSAAFTLIELLVVIVVIAILAGIALPVFGKIMEKGRVTQDCSNLRQLGIGTVAFLNDNNDTMFNTTSTGTDSNNRTLGHPALLDVNYVPNPKVFQSPFDKRPTGSPNPLSYGVNSNLLAPATAVPVWDSNITKLVAASQLILRSRLFKHGPEPRHDDVARLRLHGVGRAANRIGKWRGVDDDRHTSKLQVDRCPLCGHACREH